MSDTTVVICVAVAYLAIGALNAARRSIGMSLLESMPSLLLWPFALDIQIKGWLAMRRVEREMKR